MPFVLHNCLPLWKQHNNVPYPRCALLNILTQVFLGDDDGDSDGDGDGDGNGNGGS